MKNRVESYISFSRKEKAGLAVLLTLLLLLLGVKATMHLWVRPDMDTTQENRLRRAWETYKNSQPTPAHAIPDVVNVNTADSATLVALKGIGPATAHKIIERRNTAGPFTDAAQLREIGAFSDSAFAELKKHITFSSR